MSFGNERTELDRIQVIQQGNDALPAMQQRTPMPEIHQKLEFPQYGTFHIHQKFEAPVDIHQVFQVTQHGEPSLHQQPPNEHQTTTSDLPQEHEPGDWTQLLFQDGDGNAPPLTQQIPHAHHAESSLRQPLPYEELPSQDVMEEMISEVIEFKNEFPVSRVKKLMKATENVKVATHASAVLGKACELFIQDLTRQAWIHTQEEQRRTLKRNDIAKAIRDVDHFQFLKDTVPIDQ